MPKRVFIVHGWDGYPEEGWFPWLKRELEFRGFFVVVPQLPEAVLPRIQSWIPALARVVGVPDEETYFVGHSMGCQTIVRFLEAFPDGNRVGGAVFVAGFLKRLTNLEEDKEVQEIAKEWLTSPVDLAKVRERLNKCVAIFSDNDPYVPLDNQEDFREKLGAETIIETQQGHFSGSQGVTELPSALEAVLKIAG